MNAFGIIILLTILIDFTLNIAADRFNLKMLNESLPEAFVGVYDENQYQKSQAYLRENTRFGWVAGTFNTMVTLTFWFSEGFSYLDRWVRAFGMGPVLSGLIYMGILLLFKSVLSLPFSVYGTFVIEEKFGFNRTTPKTFVLDTLKGLGLTVVLGAPILAGILAFFQFAGGNAWWYCWIAVSLFMLGVQYIAPTWIMPLFNKFKPLAEGELREAILNYARSIRFSLENIFVMDGSRRSSKSNAFFTGFGKHKRIVLFDTLIDRNSTQALLAVLAHEMGHFKKKHILQMTLMGIAQTGLLFFLLSFFVSFQGLFDAFYMDEKSVYAGMIFFGMLYAPLAFFIGIFMQMLSRKNEYEADRFAVETTREATAMIDALKRLSVDNLSNLTPHPFYVFLNYSHPPVLKRIEAIEKAAENSDI
jgi:STE24 endopeptidase